MAQIPFFKIRADGSLQAITIDRPADKWAKAIQIMRQGLRFECGVTQLGVELMIVDRNGSKPRKVAVENCFNGSAFVRAGVDRLIDNFHARLVPAGRRWLQT